MHRPRDPIKSIVEHDVAGLSNAQGVILLSSDSLRWPGVVARKYANPASSATAVVPAMDETILILQLAGEVDLSGKLVRSFPAERSSPGNLWVVPRGEPSEWAWNGPCELLHVYLAPTLFAAVATQTIEIDSSRIEIIARVGLHDPLVQQIGLAMLGELQQGGRLGRIYIETLTHTLAVHMLRNHAVIPNHVWRQKGGLLPYELRRIDDYIHAYLANDLTLTEIASVVHLSPYHFARLFRRSIGQSVHQYVIRCRIDTARQLLSDGRLTLAEIAAQVGFTDQSHLSYHFKRLLGFPPGAFIAQRTNLQEDRTNLQDHTS